MIDVVRRKAPPKSLSKKNSYRGADVLDALHEDFLGKCYLCETMVGHRCGEVDHRIPKADLAHGGADLTFEWSNLFPTCRNHACNQRRARTMPEGGWLSPGESVEKRILQWWRSGIGPSFAPRDGEDLPAANAVEELIRIHGDLTPQGRDLRAAMFRHMDAFTDLQMRMQAASGLPVDSSATDVEAFRAFTRRSSPYFAMIRSRVLPALECYLVAESREWLKP